MGWLCSGFRRQGTFSIWMPASPNGLQVVWLIHSIILNIPCLIQLFLLFIFLLSFPDSSHSLISILLGYPAISTPHSIVSKISYLLIICFLSMASSTAEELAQLQQQVTQMQTMMAHFQAQPSMLSPSSAALGKQTTPILCCGYNQAHCEEKLSTIEWES